MNSTDALLVRVITQAFKELDKDLARAGHEIEHIAGSHLGLGTRMCHDLGWDEETIVKIVRESLQTVQEDVD